LGAENCLSGKRILIENVGGKACLAAGREDKKETRAYQTKREKITSGFLIFLLISSSMEHVFTQDNFDGEVLKSIVPVFVDFWASWCGPCQMMGPIVDELAKEFEGKAIKIGKCNVDENGDVAAQYNIMSIPLFMASSIFIKDYDKFTAILILGYFAVWIAILKIRFHGLFQPIGKKYRSSYYSISLLIIFFMVILFISWALFSHFSFSSMTVVPSSPLMIANALP